jgi:nucleoside-diphosphate-sugar epimerase
MRVLVTGGAGYFGEVLVRHFRARGDAVRVLDRVELDARPDDVEMIRADVRDAEACSRACDGMDVVVHAVAQVPLAKDRRLFHSVNVEGARVLLHASARARVRKVVVISSSAVFGAPRALPVTEGTVPHPREAYGRAKLEAERVALDFVARGLDVTLIRPRTILGHGRLGIFQILFEWVRRGRPVYVLGTGDNRYQFVHADDLADACLRASDRVGADVFNVGAERFGTMRDLLEGLVAHAGTKSRVRSLPSRVAVGVMDLTSRLGLSPLGAYHALMYGRAMYFDVTHAKATLGWRATRSNDQMIGESYDYYVDNRDEILARRDSSHHRSAVRLGILRALDYLP